MISIDGLRMTVETSTLTATLEAGYLVSLKSRLDGREHVAPGEAPVSALQLTYASQGAVDVVGKLASNITAHQLSANVAQFRFHGWNADGVLTVSVDEASGDLLVEPSAFSSVPDAQACRWPLPPLAEGLEVIAPFFQGVRLKPDDPLLRGRWPWPMSWEAGLLIFPGREGGFWLHCQDDQYRYKAVDIAEGGRLSLETEAYGPLGNSLGAGGVVWRLNTFRGGWQIPAGQYRDWLWQVYGLGAAERGRKPWIHDLRFAVSWYGGDPALLDALAEKLDPATVLLHYSNWRTDAYDENYPDYVPSEQAKAVFARAREMGFHLAPHCNSVDMDPTHPTYALLRDFQYRDAVSRRLHGWAWDNESGGVLGVPNSYQALSQNRRRKVMVKVHPGHAMWRSILCERILDATRTVGTDSVFIDVTLCSGNLDNCLVENTTSSEGMKRLIGEVAALGEGLAVGGEGLNEITMQNLSFAQAHLFRSWHASDEGLARTGGCALNEFLFGKLCRTFGYSGLGGHTPEQELRMDVHLQHGAIPTVTVGSAAEIADPNPAVARMIELASA
jgi:hypothetical protein